MLLSDLAPEIAAELACPSWCCLPANHGENEEVQKYTGGIPRHHEAVAVTVVQNPENGTRPVTVQLTTYSEFHFTDGLFHEGPTVLVDGVPTGGVGLTPDEAVAVGRGLAEAALPLSSVGGV